MTKIETPNDKAWTLRTAKAGKCQWCESKVELKDQYTVHNDLDANSGKGAVVKKKIGARAAAVIAASTSHWCADCAEKRQKMAQRWLDRRAGIDAPPRTAAKKNGSAKKAAKAPAKPAKKAKPAVKAPAAKAAKPAVKKPGKPKPKSRVAPKAAPASSTGGGNTEPF